MTHEIEKIVSALIIQNDKSLQAGTWNNIYKKYKFLDL